MADKRLAPGFSTSGGCGVCVHTGRGVVVWLCRMDLDPARFLSR